MIRTAIAAGLLLVLSACQGGDGTLDLDYTVVVNDDAGRLFTPRLSPDGSRLAWAMPVDGQGAIFVADADGSSPVRLTHGVWDSSPLWSPDGRWIAYSAEAPDFDVFVVPSEGGEPRHLTSGPGRDEPAGWLPDGSAVLVFRRGAGDVQTLAVPLDGGPARLLVPQLGGDQFVSVSPDGSKVAFDLHRGGTGTIWVQDLAGGAARQLTTEGLEDASTAYMWSPDGRYLAHLSRRTGTMDIWIANVETGELRQLTSDIRNDVSPRWSPDGRWIAFQSDRGGQPDLWIVPASGGPALRVTQDLAWEDDLAWSPDGRGLYYSRFELSGRIQIMAATGGAARALAGWDGYQAFNPVVSPDGRTVLFQSDRSGNFDIWAVPLDGGEPVPFAASPLDDTGPQYSPDGSQVLFTSDRAGSDDVWVMPSAGGEAEQLTDWPSSESKARWSPDGSLIAFVSNRDATQGDVWIVPADGGEATRLTTRAGITNDMSAPAPAWAPDGGSIYYIGATSTGARDLYQVPVSGGSPRALGASPRIGFGALSPDGAWYAYATLEEGWAFVEVISTAGGTPRRLTTRTERVYQIADAWSPDGAYLVVEDYDLANDDGNLWTVTWPDGVWQPLTQTPDVAGFLAGTISFTPDGRQVVFSALRYFSNIMSVSVADLLAGDGRE